jgi:Domain of unknown function (DU1801)
MPRAYLDSLPEERRRQVSKVRAVIRRNLPRGYVETMNWGMITYEVPLRRFPDTYNGQPLAYAALASQKRHMAVYLSGIYGSPELQTWFEQAYRATGLRMDIGKSCVRFTAIDQLPLDLIGEAIAAVSVDQFIAMHEASRSLRASRR